MKTKSIIAALASAIVTFFLGWLIFGMLLMNYYNANSVQYTGLIKTEPAMWAIALANICWGLMIAYILNLAGITSAAKGFATGFFVFLLGNAGFDLLFYATTNMYSINILAVDILIN